MQEKVLGRISSYPIGTVVKINYIRTLGAAQFNGEITSITAANYNTHMDHEYFTSIPWYETTATTNGIWHDELTLIELTTIEQLIHIK